VQQLGSSTAHGGSDCIAMRSVVDVHASAFGLDKPGPPELGQVVAHRRLGESQAAARSPLFSSTGEELKRHDMIFTRAGSASALHALLCKCANAGSPLRIRDRASLPTVSSGRRLDCLLLTAWTTSS
jgi:hypothetical protein